MHAEQHLNIPEELRERLRSARSVFVLTGAGVSAESGVPTFRGGGDTAVWKGMPFEVISSASMVRSNLPEVWEWFDYRRGVLGHCRPNPAHEKLAAWQERFEGFTLATQNIDGLHEAAGTSARVLLELHGTILRCRCLECGYETSMQTQLDRVRAGEQDPPCERCGGIQRSATVAFGQALDPLVLGAAVDAAQDSDLFLAVGSSLTVQPAAHLCGLAKRAGARLVIVNAEPTPYDEIADVVVHGRIGEVLPELVGQV